MTARPTPPAPSTPDPVLDDDIVALLDAAITPEPLDAQAHVRIKKRLLQRIAHDTTPRHKTVQGGEGPWRDLGAGLTLKILHREGDLMSYLVRMAPGSQLPAHRHPIDEECVVMEGSVRIGTLLHIPAGGFHLGLKDVLHESIVSDEGALLFLRGAVPEEVLVV